MASRPLLSTARSQWLSAGKTLSRHHRRLKFLLRLIMRTQEVIKRRTSFIHFPHMSKPLPVRAARGATVSLFSFFIPCSSLTDFLRVTRLVALSKCFHEEQADPPPLGPPPPSKTDTQLPSPTPKLRNTQRMFTTKRVEGKAPLDPGSLIKASDAFSRRHITRLLPVVMAR